jgi:AraC family transcriptional regulator
VQTEERNGDSIKPLDWLKSLPQEAAATSDRLGWVGLEAARCRAALPFELNLPALTHHRLFLFTRPPEELDLRYGGVKRYVPPPAGSISLMPASCTARVRSSGCKDELHLFLEPGLIARVAIEAFGLDPARVTVPPLDGLHFPQLRAAMQAVSDELMAGSSGGGPLAAESLANVLAVHLIRHLLTPGRPVRRPDGALPRGRLLAVVEYIEAHLETGPSLEQMAAVARLSSYHFAHQFKRATGLPPHQYVIMRRVERAQHLLRRGDLSLAEVAARAGFPDQSAFCRHFKRLLGVTPGQFRMHTRIV